VEIPGVDLATMMVAVPVSVLAWPVRAGAEGDGRSGLVITGVDQVRTGDLVAWCKGGGGHSGGGASGRADPG